MNTISTGPKTIKRDGQVGFRGYEVKFAKNSQVVFVSDGDNTLTIGITDFLNLVEQATWYFDQFASREER